MRVHRHTNDCTVYIVKLVGFVTEGDNLCGAYKCEIEWIKEKDQVFALEISKADLLELSIDNSSALEVRGRLSDRWSPSGSAD